VTFDDVARAELVTLGAALYDRGLTPGRTGNLSVRRGEEVLITPTGASLGRLSPERLSVVTVDGIHREGERASKELPLHLALYRRHTACGAVAHLHSTNAVAVSSLAELPVGDALPALTPYHVMRVGPLPLVGYAPPGSTALEAGVARAAEVSRSMLLQNHGSLATAPTLEGAVDAVEEIEETSKIFLLLRGHASRSLRVEEVEDLRRRFAP
jgi:3-dehydro-4-phosphotetronate decarboxylase